MIWVKICATTNLPDAQASLAAGADALGFIFAPSSRRIGIEQAAEIISSLTDDIDKIGVFVNQTPAQVAEVAERAGLTGVQLHGDEPADRMPEYRQAVGQRKIIKTLQARELLNSPDSLKGYLRSRQSIDAILLDAGSPNQRGGTGQTFDWTAAAPIVARVRAQMPVIIAGGLNPENVAEAIRLFAPWGVDVVSGVEREVGRKDEASLRRFVGAARQTQATLR
ncbi:MAG: phosphoribosylanthranilate isomerase [Candidatus Korobacteraceae bacterium]|jgi:phosphoribosylanthranilate isomerase